MLDSRAASTVDGYKSGVEMFHFFLQESQDGTCSTSKSIDDECERIKNMPECDEKEDIQGDEVCDIILRFAAFLSEEVVSPSTSKALKMSSKLKYFGVVKEVFRDRFKDLRIWKDHNDGGWFSAMRAKMEKKAARAMLDNNEDEADPSQQCRALVIRCSAEKVRQGQRIWLQKDGVDLESIVTKLLLSNETAKAKFEKRAMLVMTYFATARGGEVKFIKWGDVVWDYHFNCPQAMWTRMKTLVRQLLMFQCHKDGWKCDFYHAFGCYFATGGLLPHSNTSDEERTIKRVFPALGLKSNKSIATLLTNMIRKYCDESLRQVTTSRSLRVGATTELKVNPHVSFEESSYAGGFSSKDNSGFYLRPPPSMGMSSANALNGWPTPRRHDVCPPSLQCLSTKPNTQMDGNELKNKLDALITCTFPSALTEFHHSTAGKEGRLYELSKTCFASMLMYYNDVNGQLGRTNAISTKIVESFQRTFSLSSTIKAEAMIIDWGDWIKKDFTFNNARSICIANEGIDPDYMEHQRSQTQFMQSIFSKITDYQIRLENRLNDMEGIFAAAGAATSSEHTPATNHVTTGVSLNNTTTAIAASTTCTTSTHPPKRARMTTASLLTSPSAAAMSKASLTTGSYTIHQMLIDLIKSGALLKKRGKADEFVSLLWNVATPTAMAKKDGGCFVGIMKLLHITISDDEKEYLRACSVQNRCTIGGIDVEMSDEHGHLHQIESKMVAKIQSLDGKDVRRPHRAGGIGKRAREYFKHNMAADPSVYNERSSARSFFSR